MPSPTSASSTRTRPRDTRVDWRLGSRRSAPVPRVTAALPDGGPRAAVVLSEGGSAMKATHLMQTYSPQPVAFARGEGAWLWDTAGKKYLDALAGIAVSGLGHAHPVLTRAIAEQAGRLIHTSNLFQVPEQERLAAKLCAITGMDNVFFGNSGAEANECAIKLARLHGHQRGIENSQIVVMEK